MSNVVPTIPWHKWLRVHMKAICQALPVAFLLVAEGRDMYYRATWEVTNIPPSKFSSGDVIAVCNRWYTLPTWQHALYSLLSKVLLKSSWDDVGVIAVAPDGTPHVFFCDFSGAQDVPLDEFIRTRMPRGLALRKLHPDPGLQKPNASVALLFIEEARKIQPSPWYLFSASMRSGQEHRYYEFCVNMNEQRQKIAQMQQRHQSREAISAQRTKLREMEVMRAHIAKFVHRDRSFRLFNGSLVASFLATFGFLDRELPSPSRYVPQDFAHTPPLTGASALEEPVIFFKN